MKLMEDIINLAAINVLPEKRTERIFSTNRTDTIKFSRLPVRVGFA